MPDLVYFLSHPIQYQVPLIRRIVESGLDMEVVYQTTAGAESYFDAEFNQQVAWDIPLLSGYRYHVLPAASRSASLRKQATLHLQNLPPKAVWAHGWGTPYARAGWFAARDLGIPVLMRGDAQLLCRKGGPARRLAHRILLTWLFRRVDHFLAIGSANRDYYRHYGVPDSRITLMPYAVDNDFFMNRCASASPARESLRHQLGIPAGAPVILFAGKFIWEKSLDVLLQAMGKMMRTSPAGPKPHLLLAGDGLLRGELEPLAVVQAPGHIHFLGFQNQSAMPALYDLCDVFVLPSVFDQWGLVVNEAMCAGKPVVVSDHVGASRDLVRPGQNGSVFPASDVDALAAALQHWCRPDAAAAGGRVSLEIIGRWDLDSNVKALHHALATLGSPPA